KLDIESTWTNYQAAQEQYKHYSKAIEYNKYTRTAYLEQFQIGKRSLLDVLDTENELYNSSTQAETARGNILVGAYRLCALTGDLLPQMSINTGPLGQNPPEDKEDPREAFAPGWFN
ncbi:TolC family protein, partial [uncultured Desulfovibrio sp.]